MSWLTNVGVNIEGNSAARKDKVQEPKDYPWVDNRWSFNGNYERPTFSPSIKVEIGHYPDPSDICHSFVTDGKIKYLNDCTHELAEKTIDLEGDE